MQESCVLDDVVTGLAAAALGKSCRPPSGGLLSYPPHSSYHPPLQLVRLLIEHGADPEACEGQAVAAAAQVRSAR